MLRLLCLLASLASLGPLAGLAADAPPLHLRVMTFNLRYASNQPPHAWPERRPVMRRLLEREAPDVIGTQEGLYPQLLDLAADLPAYAWIGLGRSGGSRGEFMAIFYRRDRFDPVAFDHFWLSDTPELIGSATWGNRYQRMVTWVRLRERATGRELDVWNTHFDHEVEAARLRAARLLRDRLPAPDPARPLVLLGDFNCLAGASAPYTLLTQEAGLADAWALASTRGNDGLDTFHGYQPPRRQGERIDWILLRGARSVRSAATLDYAEQGRTPSDHFPVVADVEF